VSFKLVFEEKIIVVAFELNQQIDLVSQLFHHQAG
jgi:hypothetical protein